MSNLYEISDRYNNLRDLLENDDIPLTVIEEAMAQVEGEFNDKASNIVKLIRTLEADAKAIKEEKSRLDKMEKARSNKAKYLKLYLESNMKATGIKKCKADIFTLAIQKNPPSVDVYDFDKLPDEYRKVEISADNTKIKDALKNGIDVPGAILCQSESIRIR